MAQSPWAKVGRVGATVAWTVVGVAALSTVLVGLEVPNAETRWWPTWAWPPEWRGHETHLSPDGGRWQLALLVVGTLASAVATVGLAVRRPVLLRWPAFGATVVGAAGIVVVTPDVVETAARSWIRIPVGLVLAVVALRLLILLRLAAGFRSPAAHPPTPLPHQQVAMDRLELPKAGTRSPVRAPSRRAVKQLVGRWGEGKSFVVGAIEAEACRPSSRCLWPWTRPHAAVVVVDVWKHASEADLHKAIVRQILYHPALALPFGWLWYPLGMITEMSVRDASFKVPFAKAEINGSLAMPRLAWQRPLERALIRVTRRGRTHVVVVLDEIDRSSDVAAQAAVTLAERSLDRPGVTVLLSFVDEVLPHKVVSPLVDQLDDLRSTTTALLLDHLEGNPARWTELRDDLIGPTTADRPEVTVVDALRRAYVRMPARSRQKLRARTTEKLMDTHRVVLDALPPDDLSQMLTWPEMDVMVGQLLGPGNPLDATPADAARAYTGGAALPPLRALKSALQHELAMFSRTEEAQLASLGATGRKHLLVFLVLLAIDAADQSI